MKDYGIPADLHSKDELLAWKNKILSEQLAVIYYDLTGQNPSGLDLSKVYPKIKLSDNQVYAYLVPAVLDRLPDASLQQASLLIAAHLACTDLKPIAHEHYFQAQITTVEEQISMTNENRRSLQFFTHPDKSASNHSTLKWRDKTYRFQHTHIHFEHNGEEKEYEIKDVNGTIMRFDGEVHNVFEYVLPKEEGKSAPRKRLIAVGSPLKIVDKPNQDIQSLLDKVKISEQQWQQDVLRWQTEVTLWENRANKNDSSKKPAKPILNLEQHLDFGKVFMNSLNAQSEHNELIYHSWASLRSGTHGFQSGLRFIMSTKPLQVSKEQYDVLKKLFGEMRTNLQEEEILDPIDRKAGWRKERTTLIEELRRIGSPPKMEAF